MLKTSDRDIAGNQTSLQEAGMETGGKAGIEAGANGGYGDYPAKVIATLKKIERKNRVPMTGVDIRFNSSFPAQMDARATTYGGRRVDIGPGQEASMNHELGHIVQQRLGLVKATGTVAGRKVNTDRALEADATLRGTV